MADEDEEDEMEDMDEILDGDADPELEEALEDTEPEAAADPVFAAPPSATGPKPPAPSLPDLLGDIELEATLQFGFREMRLRELLGLDSGDVVELNRHVSEPVELVVGDRILARGEVVVANGNFALRIIEVVTPQLRLESIGCLI